MENINPENDILYLVKTLNKALAQDFDKRLAEYDLTGQQGRLLFYINRTVNIEGNKLHQNDIEKLLGLSKSTVSGLIDRLETKELIKRVPAHPYVEIVPTKKCSNIVNHIHSNRDRAIEKLLKGFTVEEKESIIKNIKIQIWK